jgi:hypothetical protein
MEIKLASSLQPEKKECAYYNSKFKMKQNRSVDKELTSTTKQAQ